MQLPSGTVIAAAVSGCTAAFGTSMLIASAKRRAGAVRRAHRLLAAGAGLATLSALIGLAGTLLLAGDWAHHQAERSTLATAVAIGFTVSGVVLFAGLLRLPGAAGTLATAFRLVLDALVIAAALWFVGWVLLVEAIGSLVVAAPMTWAAILLGTVVVAVAVGLTVVVAMRSPRPRYGSVSVGCGVSLVGAAGLGLATGIHHAGLEVALAGAGAVPAGLLVIAVASRTIDSSRRCDADFVRHASAYAFLPMLAMAVSAIYHLLQEGDFDLVGIVAGSVEGFALVGRQYLALRDVRAYAGRLVEREAHFRELAHTDPLTGLANRRGLLRALYAEAESDRPCMLLALDLDGFKNVNDIRGHDVGDAVLVEVGQRLRANLRPGDVAARLGGDEFAIVMWAGLPEAQRVAERLLGVLGGPYDRPEGRIFLSVSIGLAGYASRPDVDELLRNADLALRYAKQRGKNRVERYDIAYDQLLRRRTTLEHELRGAIERGELHLVYQPVVAVPSVRPVGAEALLRWHHPELGSVGPDEFIPLAEECGMIAKLGAWVLHEACHQLSLWRAAGHDVWLSVNVSPYELHTPEYVVQVAEALRVHHVPPQRLVLEITEHAVATDLDEMIRRLGALRLTGVRIALDDFGAGYSSLGQLRKLPVDILKIDHSLVAGQEPARRAVRQHQAFAPMVDVVVRLGHQLGLEVIAEGVTNQAEYAAVVGAGCRFGQGQLFGWGVPAEHLEAMLHAATSAGARVVSAPRSLPAGPTGSTAPAPTGEAAARGTPWEASSVPPAPRRPSRLEAESSGATPAAQNMGAVDSSREMRQA